MATDNLIAPTVTSNLPGGRYSAPQISDAPGRELAMLGHSTGRAAGDIFRVEMRMKHDNDTLRVNAELNAMKELDIQLRYGEGGMYSKKGLDAINTIGPDTYSDQLVEKQKEILSSLANDQQRQMFMQGSNNIISSFREAGIKHLNQERTRYDISVQEGTIKNAINEMPLAVAEGDEDSYHKAMSRSDAALFRLKEVNGWSAEEFEVKKREKDSHVTKQVVGHLLDNGKWEQAEKWLESNKEWMSAEGVFWSRQRIDKVKKEAVGQQIASQLYRMSRAPITETDVVLAITKQAESGGRRWGEDGNLLESPKGAKGEMQVMDSTNLDPGFGVSPAKDNSPEERARVGRDYLFAMIKRYDGDMERAWAAYNWGPGAVDKAIEQYEKKTAKDGVFNPNGWLENAPKETRDYVAKNMALLEKEKAKVGTPAVSHTQISEQFSAITDPKLRQIVMSNYEAQVRFGKAREQDASDAAMKTAMNMLPSVGFQMSRLPQNVTDAINPKELPALQTWAANMAKGDDVTDPAVYQYFITHPEALRLLTDDQFFKLRQKLSDADWRRLANQRTELISGKGKNTAGDLDTAAITRGFNENMRMMGLNPSPKDGTSEAAMIGAKRQALDTYIAAAQRSAGRKFNDVELNRHISAFFMQAGVSTGWFGNSRQPLMSMGYGDIGWHTRQQIIESLTRSGIPPTEANVLNAFILSNVMQDKG